MKILFITHKYPPSVGGMEKHCFHLVQGVSKNNECIVHAYDPIKESKFKFFLLLKFRIKKILKSNPDIGTIYLNDGLMVAFSLWLKRITDIPVVATFHGLDILFPLSIYQKLIVPKFSYLSKLIAVSQHTADALLERNMPAHKVQVVKNGVDLDLNAELNESEETIRFNDQYLKPLKDKHILLMVGRPVKRKGMSWFLDKVLRNLDDRFHVLICGSFDKNPSFLESMIMKLPQGLQKQISLFLGLPADKMTVRKLAGDAELKSKLTLLPRLSDAELNFVYQKSNAFVMPNIKVDGDAEGFGLVALEASINGLPVFCAGIEGIKDAIQNNINGIHIESENAEAWINTLSKKMSDQKELDRLAKAFNTFTIENYSWEKMTKAYEDIFRELSPNKSEQLSESKAVFSLT